MGHTADVVAVTLGACAVEKHFTLSRNQAGPDHPFALEPDELAAMVTAIRETEASLGSSVKRVTEAEAEMFRLGRRSLVASRDVAAGAALTRDDLAIKRPGFGIPVHDIDHVVGTPRLARAWRATRCSSGTIWFVDRRDADARSRAASGSVKETTCNCSDGVFGTEDRRGSLQRQRTPSVSEAEPRCAGSRRSSPIPAPRHWVAEENAASRWDRCAWISNA